MNTSETLKWAPNFPICIKLGWSLLNFCRDYWNFTLLKSICTPAHQHLAFKLQETYQQRTRNVACFSLIQYTGAHHMLMIVRVMFFWFHFCTGMSRCVLCLSCVVVNKSHPIVIHSSSWSFLCHCEVTSWLICTCARKVSQIVVLAKAKLF